jgi:hypothetical protein
LLDALKPGNRVAPRPSAGSGSGGQPGGGGGGSGADREDQLPSLAQLKALRALQQEVNERTQAFARQHPDKEKLTKKDADELHAIGQEQVEIADLFQQLTAPVDIQGEKK